MALRVVTEVAPRRAFASAFDWPGWARAGRTPDDAIAALLAHAPRYAAVAGRAGIPFDVPCAGHVEVEVVERLPGGAGTEFGVPGAIASLEEADVSAADHERLVVLLRAAWATFDAAARSAEGVTLATGPRGGGRDLLRMIEHVRAAEVSYVGQLGSRAPGDAGMAEIRDAFLTALGAAVRGEAVPNPRRTKRPWPPRYAVRRSAWHALDHAWELDDRTS